MIDRDRVSRGATAAAVAASAGAIGFVAIVLFFPIGQPFGTINDLASLVMIAALQPVMLAHYELGGVVPLWPARLSLAGATAAVVAWAALQVVFVLRTIGIDVAGLGSIDVNAPATGVWAVQAILQGLIGLWIAGASLLAGRWLPLPVRTLGIVTGLGVVLMSVGIVGGGYSSMLTNVGGVGFQILLPIWVFLLGRVFRARAASAVAQPVSEGAPA